MKVPEVNKVQGQVHCPICTHSVPAQVLEAGKRVTVAPGQKCQWCHSSLDAAAILYLREAA